MNISVTCISCGKKLSAPEGLAGKRVPCPKCNAPVDVPLAATVVERGPAPVAAQAARPPAMPRQVSDADLLDLGLDQPGAAPLGSVPRIPAHAGGRPSGGGGLAKPLIALAIVLFLVGGAIGAFIMLSGKGGAGSDLRYLPDDPDFIATVNVSGLINSGAGQKIKSHSEDMLAAFSKGLPKDSKFKPEDVGRMTFAAKVQDKNGAGVIHFNRPITEQDVPPLASGTKKTVGQYQVAVDHDVAFCLLDPQTLLTGDENTVRKVLERNGSAKMSDELTAAMAEVDFSKPIAVAGSLKNLASLTGAPGRAAPAGVAGGLGGAMSGITEGIRGGALQCDVNDDIRMHGVVICKDANTATQIKAMVDGFLPLIKMQAAGAPGPAAKGMKILDTLQVSTSGSSVRADLTIDTDLLISLIPTQMGKGTIESSKTETATGGAPAENAPPSVPTLGPPTEKEMTPRAPQFNANPPANGGAAPRAPRVNPQNALNRAGGRNPAQQMMASNNLKQIALAIHSYAAKEDHFPPAAITDTGGKPLLSWRVAVLQYLGPTEQRLYEKFHLDEPWDSPNNKKLLTPMPRVYRQAGGRPMAANSNKTCILAPVGDSYALASGKGRSMADFRDGMSNTILLVEAPADKAVEWTKPDDLAINEADASAGLFAPGESAFLAAFADGAVKTVPQTLGKDAIHALFTINGGETVPSF